VRAWHSTLHDVSIYAPKRCRFETAVEGTLPRLHSHSAAAQKERGFLAGRGIFAWNPWRIFPALGFALLYILLDRLTVFFQMWSGVSAWYPPVGVELALLVGFGLLTRR
jgi:hypothetical protein